MRLIQSEETLTCAKDLKNPLMQIHIQNLIFTQLFCNPIVKLLYNDKFFFEIAQFFTLAMLPVQCELATQFFLKICLKE